MYESQKDQLQQQSWNMEQAGMMQDNLKSPLSSSSTYISLLMTPLLLPRAQFLSSLSLAVAVIVVMAGFMLIRKRAPGLGAGGKGTDVMVTVDALKTTNKELKKQYGKINIDKSRHSSPTGLLDTDPKPLDSSRATAG